MLDNFQGCPKLSLWKEERNGMNSVYDSREGMPDKVGASSVRLFP